MRSVEPAPRDEKPKAHNTLNRLRRERGWSHERLALESGVRYITIQRIELGLTREPHEATKFAIAQALEVEVFALWP